MFGPWLLIALALVTMLLPPRGAGDAAVAARSPLRIGLVFDVGGRGDKSFNDAAWAGLERARRELGVTVEYVEPADGDDRAGALRLFAARGFDRVIGVGYVFSRDVDAVALDHPDTRFACIDYAPPERGDGPRNVVGLKFREEEGAFLVGAAAGLSTARNAVGFVGGMEIPLIRRFEAGYRAGVGAVCPSCRVLAAYAGSTPTAFKDPERGAQLATAQIAAGADILFHASGSTGHGVFVAAQRLGARAIGVDADQHDEMPGVVLTSMLKRVDVAVFELIREATQGRYERGARGLRTFGLAEGGVDWVHEGPHASGLRPEVIQRVEALRQRIIRGEIAVPGRE
ncbi:MAG: BMP family ABC transporter substrate-binding protein [Deltaproteobacteria bacterium]|nr:BMP family ABC transporter substrate-binding protein [Deltaproteobacteria bacterium]MBK7067615.1 BMP family ABC transporter substrate-binding protein [Deltaproteobacteria bacterium]MBP6830371.1 BMP family ABC transporter substrate-binding protein [Deltaproteobacteria bacterium]